MIETSADAESYRWAEHRMAELLCWHAPDAEHDAMCDTAEVRYGVIAQLATMKSENARLREALGKAEQRHVDHCLMGEHCIGAIEIHEARNR